MARFWQFAGKKNLKLTRIKLSLMKRIVLTLAAVTFSIGFSVAQEKMATPVKPAATASTSLAEITFEKETHDFGTIEYAGNGTYEFKFKNTGKEPLIISDAKGSCGCT